MELNQNYSVKTLKPDELINILIEEFGDNMMSYISTEARVALINHIKLQPNLHETLYRFANDYGKIRYKDDFNWDHDEEELIQVYINYIGELDLKGFHEAWLKENSNENNKNKTDYGRKYQEKLQKILTTHYNVPHNPVQKVYLDQIMEIFKTQTDDKADMDNFATAIILAERIVDECRKAWVEILDEIAKEQAKNLKTK